MLTIRYSTRFKRDYKLVKKRGYDISLMEEVLEILCSGLQDITLLYRFYV
jgi:mRNA interferase YafQ